MGAGALWNQEGQQDHGLLDCSSQPWLKRLKKDPGPNEAWVLGDESWEWEKTGFATRVLILHSGCQLESLRGL